MPISRRQFLKLLALAFASAACQPVEHLLPGGSPDSTEIAEIPTNTIPLPHNPPSTLESAEAPGEKPAFGIVDGHEDIAWNWVEFGRDPLQSALEIRLRERGQAAEAAVGPRTIGLPEWQAGGIGLIFATIFTMPAAYASSSGQQAVYATPEEAHRTGWEQMVYYHGLVQRSTSLTLVKSQKDLQALADSRSDPAASKPPPIGMVLLMEGAEPIADPDDLHEWHRKGLRLLGPAWKSTRYAAGAGEEGGLTRAGRKLLREMEHLGMILDLSHLSPAATLEALERYSGPLIASHSNPQRFLPTERGLTDEMIRQIAGCQGVVGINFYNAFLKPGWQRGDGRDEVTLETVADAIDYVVQLTGSSAHVALGTDLDGGFGLDCIPQGLDTVADLVKVGEVLAQRGYAPEDVSAVMSGNWLRLLQQGLPE